MSPIPGFSIEHVECLASPVWLLPPCAALWLPGSLEARAANPGNVYVLLRLWIREKESYPAARFQISDLRIRDHTVLDSRPCEPIGVALDPSQDVFLNVKNIAQGVTLIATPEGGRVNVGGGVEWVLPVNTFYLLYESEEGYHVEVPVGAVGTIYSQNELRSLAQARANRAQQPLALEPLMRRCVLDKRLSMPLPPSGVQDAAWCERARKMLKGLGVDEAAANAIVTNSLMQAERLREPQSQGVASAPTAMPICRRRPYEDDL